MPNEIHDLGSRLNEAAANLTGPALREVMTRVGVAAKQDLVAVVRRDAGGDDRMSNWKRARLTSGFEHTGDGQIVIVPRPAGPWRVLSEGARPHVVMPKKARRGRRGATLRTPFGPRRLVHIPHTRGHGTWAAGERTIGDKTPGRALDEISALMRRTIGL